MIDKFICVHILKTAGTTLKDTLLVPTYKEKCLIDVSYKPKNIPKYRKKITMRVDLENQLYPPDYENYDIIFGHFKGDKYAHLNRPMFSFVRHPVERVCSNYYFFNRHHIMRRKNFEVSDSALLEFSKKYQNYMSYVLGDISRYEYIGIVEEFEKSLGKMCNILGVDYPSNIKQKRVNRFHRLATISKETKKEIENMNLKDMELYNNILNKFN